MYRLIAVDLDGTIVKDDKTIGQETRDAIKRAHEQGIYVVLASGRSFKGVQEFAEDLGLDDTYHVADNGVTLVNTSGDIINEGKFSEEEYRELIEHLRKTSKSYVITSPMSMWYETDDRSCVTTMIPNNGRMNFIKIKDALQIPSPFKINAYFDNEHDRDAILAKKFKNITGVVTYHVLIDFYPNGVSKWGGVRDIAKRLNVREDEIIAVGDNGNDIDMIEGAKLGIAVANATEETKEAADLVLDQTNNEEPLAHIIDNIAIRAMHSIMV